MKLCSELPFALHYFNATHGEIFWLKRRVQLMKRKGQLDSRVSCTKPRLLFFPLKIEIFEYWIVDAHLWNSNMHDYPDIERTVNFVKLARPNLLTGTQNSCLSGYNIFHWRISLKLSQLEFSEFLTIAMDFPLRFINNKKKVKRKRKKKFNRIKHFRFVLLF